jgi:2-dehydro-3-deoxyphosphogluconate aldolase/(4S)-4-hydroxy-2-oxoglutarate aldolase
VDISRFKAKPILGILRGIPQERLEPLLETVISAGLETLEITMNTENAPQLIKRAVRFSGARLMLGAGTVIDKQGLKTALDAGAGFIVMPVLVEEVTEYCVKNKTPVFPGAFTPQEVFRAWQAGSTMVKVFPANFFGPAYFKELKAPFDKIELLACGGLSPENIRAYFLNGASAVAFGSSVFRREWLKSSGGLKKIHRLIRSYLLSLPSPKCLG